MESSGSLGQLKSLVESICPIPEEDWQLFSSLWKLHVSRRKEILTAAGEKEKYLYFVLEGVQRIYYFDEMNREATLVFTYAPSFGGVLDSMMLQRPSKYFYETLSASVFLRAPVEVLLDLMASRPFIQGFVLKGITQSLSGVLERTMEMQCFTALERFKKLLHRSPHILQLVPQKYLANYLSIDPSNFSKLMHQVKI